MAASAKIDFYVESVNVLDSAALKNLYCLRFEQGA